MITYTITDTRFTVDADGVQDRITWVIWDATKSEGTVTSKLYARGTKIPDDYAPADKPYADVTEADCIAWVTDLEDQVSIDAQLQAQIDNLKTPVASSGVPWQDTYPLWAVGVAVVPGDVRVYQNNGYECIQGHTTQSDWAPPYTPALWKVYVPASEGPQLWVQPTGSTDAYSINDQVLWPETDTHVWTSLVDANVWEPTPANSTLWQDDGVYP